MSDRLETERLILRHLTVDDAPLMFELWNDPDFIRFVGDRGIRTLDDSRAALEEGALAMYEDVGYGPYRLTLKASGEDLGICGLFRRENLADPDIGFGLLPAFRQAGYAQEASVAVLGYARDGLGLGRVNAIASMENLRSVQLLEKLGFMYERDVRMPDDDVDIALFAIEWSL